MMRVNAVFRIGKMIFFFAVCCRLLLSADGRELSVRIIQTTDLHGSISHGRLFRIASLVKRETESAGGSDKSLRIDCGDLFQGSCAMTFPEGRSLMIRYLNSLSFDVFVPGNHDFEFGSAVLGPLLHQFSGTVLALNLDWKKAPVRSWKMFRKNGISIAVVGIAYPALEKMFIPPVLGAVRPLSVEKQMERVMPEVVRARPDLIVLALHAGEHVRFSQDFSLYDLIRKYPQIDLILCGHTHQTEVGKAVRDTWLMQAPALAQGIGIADVTFDTDRKRIVSMRTRIARPDDKADSGDSGDAGIRKAVDRLNRQTARAVSHKIANPPFELRPPEKNELDSAWTRICGKAIMACTGAEIVFYAPGSRYRVKPGLLSEYSLFCMMPYDEYAVVVELNADEIRRIMDEQMMVRKKGGMYQPFSSLHFTASGGGRRGRQRYSAGLPLENGRTYRTAFGSYIFSGSGRCRVLHAVVNNKKPWYSYPKTIREMTADYVREAYPLKKK